MPPKKPDPKSQVKSDPKSTPKAPANSKSAVIVKYGKPVLQVEFKRIKFFVALFVLMSICMLIYGFSLLVNAIKIRSHLGAFINMISSGDGEILPSLLAIPIFFFICLNVAIFMLVYKIFAKEKRPGINRILFILSFLALIMILATLITIFMTLGHIFGSNKHIENGILIAMEKYAINSHYKKEIDRLQIEFQCCGSKRYDDWYNITWLEKELILKDTNTTTASTNNTQLSFGKTPFSCCSIKSKFPCIHFDIESTGVNYQYIPEFNLSISGTGCRSKIVEKKQQIGMGIVGSLFLFIFLEFLMLIPVRFLQTGHSVDHRFLGNSKTYTVWLFGSYTGKNEKTGIPDESAPVSPDID
ncbi:unnamed protein product [Ceutorhynchus assimilis]|uniref:Tetraspanin n=1 Tax=Ceutorhynchus assimilis TaxID=467358 RepID=A0A9N9QME1_9CUCU|nr:unnamed protein product [Ceutorhynchus assimilis]